MQREGEGTSYYKPQLFITLSGMQLQRSSYSSSRGTKDGKVGREGEKKGEGESEDEMGEKLGMSEWREGGGEEYGKV